MEGCQARERLPVSPSLNNAASKVASSIEAKLQREMVLNASVLSRTCGRIKLCCLLAVFRRVLTAGSGSVESGIAIRQIGEDVEGDPSRLYYAHISS